ncbi:MAG: efflux RND transporter periplasmic adaptor subunit, partial [Oscillibacter sp.]|nr:efflux RND transporter periplasmic adaptor subunit [Oscillibacter sp.]
LETALKNQAACRAVAPISGQVIGLTITPGQELSAGTTLVSVCDTSKINISATVDERNVSYVKAGAVVTLDQWGKSAAGTVETVSLSSTVNNGVATYPITIVADNADGTLQINGYVNYSLVASQSDNCLVLPIQAVRTESTEDGDTVMVVYVRADERPENAIDLPYAVEEIPAGFYAVPVEIGIQDNAFVEILSGVEEGTEVFTQMMTNEVWG